MMISKLQAFKCYMTTFCQEVTLNPGMVTPCKLNMQNVTRLPFLVISLDITSYRHNEIVLGGQYNYQTLFDGKKGIYGKTTYRKINAVMDNQLIYFTSVKDPSSRKGKRATLHNCTLSQWLRHCECMVTYQFFLQ